MLKDIHLFTLAHEGDTSALELAEALASKAEATLACTGYIVLPDGYLGFSESLETAAVAQARREQRPDLDKFEEVLKTRPRPVRFEKAEIYPKQIEASVAARSRRSDAVVVRAPPQSHETPHAALIEAALFAGSAPVVVAPLHWHARPLGKRILMCWDDSREAARAAHEALRFAARDAHLIVATVSEHPQKHVEAGARLLAAHLARADMTSEVRTLAAHDGNVAAALDHVAQEAGADLIVLGGFSHPRLQEAMFGGVTRSILRAPSVPLLLAH